MTRQRRATLYALATVLLWSTVASAFKLSLRHLDPPQLLLHASAVSVLVLGGLLAVRGRLGVLFTYTPAQYLRSALLGILNPFLYYLVLFEAYDRLPAQEAQPLNYTWAITLALLSVPLLGQRLRLGDIAGGLVSYAGVVVISTRGDPLGLRFSDPLGVALALGSTVLWSLYWIGNTRDDRDPVAGLLLNFLFGMPFVLAWCALFSDVRVADPRGLLGAAYVDGGHLRALAPGAAPQREHGPGGEPDLPLPLPLPGLHPALRGRGDPPRHLGGPRAHRGRRGGAGTGAAAGAGC